MPDPHLMRKIETATSREELDGIVAGFDARGELMPEDARNAITFRRAELDRQSMRASRR